MLTFVPVMEKKQEIVQKVTEIFLSQGIRSVTMEDLSRLLGISKKTLYQYFTDKTDLLQQVISNRMGKHHELCTRLVDESKNAIESLLSVTATFGEFLRGIHPDFHADLIRLYPEVYQRFNCEHEDFSAHYLLKNIERGRKEGLYRGDFDEELVARIFLNAITQIVIGNPNQMPRDVQLRGHEFNQAIQFLLYALLSESGRQFVALKNQLHA